MPDYDIITVGGGLGGASFAKAMAERGARVLVVEREAKFKDRVRGEWLAPWGVAEAHELGVYETLISQCGYHIENTPAPMDYSVAVFNPFASRAGSIRTTIPTSNGWQASSSRIRRRRWTIAWPCSIRSLRE